MKYVLTGVTNRLGAEICQYLVSNQQEVYAICNASKTLTATLPESDLFHVIYLYKPEYRYIKDQIPNADVLVNLDWEETVSDEKSSKENLALCIDTNMDALVAARNMGCKLFVNTGSYEEYGITKEKQSERTLLFPLSENGRAKKVIEEMASEYLRFVGIKYLHLRLFSIYGLFEQHDSLITMCIEKMQNNERLELPSCVQNWNYIYIKDAVKQMALLMEYALQKEDFRTETFQIASEDTRSLQYFINELKRILNSRSELIFSSMQPNQEYSLQPDIKKTKEAIGFVSDYTFERGIENIIINNK